MGLLYLRPRQSEWKPQAARVKLPDSWRDTWNMSKTTDINEVEAASAPIALTTWPTLADGLWLHFTDNSSAEATLAKGSAKVTSMNTIAEFTWTTCASRRLYLWVDRVATADSAVAGEGAALGQSGPSSPSQDLRVPLVVPQLVGAKP